jgi:hypothetical protein
MASVAPILDLEPNLHPQVLLHLTHPDSGPQPLLEASEELPAGSAPALELLNPPSVELKLSQVSKHLTVSLKINKTETMGL